MSQYPERILPGYKVPLYRVLTEKILLGGAPRNYVIALSTLSAVICLGLRMVILGVIIWAIGMAFGVFMARRDPQFMDVTLRHIKHEDKLEC